MNLSTIALILLAWHVLTKGNGQQDAKKGPPNLGLTDFLSEDTKNILNCAQKLSSDKCSQEDRTSAIFQMMSNPAVMNIASNLFGGLGNMGNSATTGAPEQQEQTATGDADIHTNSEGYKFETPSAASVEFFRPIDNIADTEIKHKLYWFYDNWYVK